MLIVTQQSAVFATSVSLVKKNILIWYFILFSWSHWVSQYNADSVKLGKCTRKSIKYTILWVFYILIICSNTILYLRKCCEHLIQLHIRIKICSNIFTPVTGSSSFSADILNHRIAKILNLFLKHVILP